MGRNVIDLTGQQFGRLTVIERDPVRTKSKMSKWKCQCDCGNTVSVLSDSLRKGRTKSCGCLSRESAANIYKIDGTQVTKLIPREKLASNNTSGKRGVSWNKQNNVWEAYIKFKGIKYHLGISKDFEKAAQLRDEAEELIYGDFLGWYAETHPEEWKRLDKKHK